MQDSPVSLKAVSYTHLDVYKRQVVSNVIVCVADEVAITLSVAARAVDKVLVMVNVSVSIIDATVYVTFPLHPFKPASAKQTVSPGNK